VEFSEWIDEQLKFRGWKRYGLSKEMGMSENQISRVYNKKQNPGRRFLIAMAKAFDVEISVVMQAAGMLDIPSPEDKTHDDKRLKEIRVKYNTLDERDKEEIYNLVQIKYRRKQRKKKAEG
jgi:transcriptional regulator with XRE-family HTH domain